MADRDQRTLHQVWPEIRGELTRFAVATGINRDQADDMLQDVFIVATERGLRSAPLREWRAWLFRVTCNRCRLEQRRHGRWRRAWQQLVKRQPPVASPEIDASRHETQDRVRNALERMSDEHRTLLVLRYYCDFNSTEIANMLNLASSTVRNQLRSARCELAKSLGGSWEPL